MLAQLKTNSDLHVKRKLFHFLSIFIIFMCMISFSPKINWFLYLVIGVPGILIDILRQNSVSLNRLALKVLGPVLRKTEIRKLSGACFAILAVGLIYFIFPKPVAQLSTLFLAVGDPIASFFGILLGKHILLGKKSLEGFIAAFLFCTLSAFLFFNFQMKNSESLLLLSLSCGFIGALSELIPIADLDDNLTQPIISSLLLTLLFAAHGGL